MGVRKLEDVEKLLQWAYRHELPKAERDGSFTSKPAISPMFRSADLGGRVDDWSHDPGFPIALGAPHPDALLIDFAVRGLQPTGIDWAASRTSLIPDLLYWIPPNDARMKSLSFSPAALLTIHARMGTRPQWDLGPSRVVRVNGKNGKPIVQHLADDGALVDGRTTGRHYGPGARCPLKLDPPAQDIAFARAEYAAWHAGLLRVAETMCAWNPSDHMPAPPRAVPAPWITGEEKKSRILRSNRTLGAIA